ncbi:hypothetical protein SLEP1_g12769 [Rubroshorea leprosula]|uniref:Pectinesterase n=1 Tax=Rubroshorea leprosula TaxID=152421 RepID=A0AAV5INC9_9ROSI|nr:hypothetical protein SLEP1_g12769 [Rubroshorea leprosula]
MVFQDFDLIQERRRQERQRKFRKRVTIAAIAIFILLILVAAGIFAVVMSKKNEEEKSQPAKGKSTHSPSTSNGVVKDSEKMIKTICNGTLYQDSCLSTLQKVVKNNPTAKTNPKDLIKLGISATADKLEEAFTKINKLEFNTPEEKQAFEICKQVVDDAKEELQKSAANMGDDLGKLGTNHNDTNSWLSAVMSYQENCIDAFSEGKLRSNMKEAFNASQELTSNALAMVKQMSSIISSVTQMPTGSRHLLQFGSLSMRKDGLPKWMNREERRMLKADLDKPTPNVTVAKDGSGNFTTISDALAAMPSKYDGRYVIFVKGGIYEEYVNITKEMVNVTIYGEGSQKSIITGNKNKVDGINTYLTATVAVMGDGFLGQAMGFRNTAGPEKEQAVALRVQADRAIFLNCRFEGYQDTLYVQAHRQFYRSCVVAGTVDFIFGDAAAIFQNCLIYVRKPMKDQQNTITAQGRVDKFQTTGIVLQNCKIQPEDSFASVKSEFKTYLGRPWKQYSRTVIMESTIEDLIDPAGWLAWDGDFALTTLFYAEFNNLGSGAEKDGRVKWPGLKSITKEEAKKFTVGSFLQGEWLNATSGSVHFGLFK